MNEKVLKLDCSKDKRSAWWSNSILSVADTFERCWQIEEPERTGCLAKVVKSNFFGMVCGAVIFANAIFILYATDYEMQNLHQPVSSESEKISVSVAELLLASFYVFELFLKLIVHRFYFFWNSEMAWNWFDFVLVLFSIIENVLSFVLLSTNQAGEPGGSGVNLGFLRLLRLCKIVKILRVFRTLRFFSELRLMLDCVVGSLMNVFWCLIMLLFVMYVFALLLQQGVVQHLQEARPSSDVQQGCADEGGLQTYFSSVGVTVVTLFQSCTSGVDWNEPYKALQETGSFLPDFEDCRMLATLFRKMLLTDEQGHERLGLEEFRKLVETDEFRSYLQTRGIDIKNAETFFKMLVELQGAAKSLPEPILPVGTDRAQPDKATEQRLADAEQALAESLWLSQKGQRISRVEVKVERHLRTQELLHLRLTWQAWEDLVKAPAVAILCRRAVCSRVEPFMPAGAISPLDMALDMLKVQIPNSSTNQALLLWKSGSAARDAGWPAARRSRPRFKAESGLSLEAAAAAAVIWSQLEEHLGEDSSCQSSSSSSPDEDAKIPTARRRKRRQRYSCIVFAPPVVR
eukprot:s1719_g13.t1